ncbi:MAG: phosphate/phosphite/phosphonate ABC transporter substrate-binding protein [Pseudomonadota bacterium]
MKRLCLVVCALALLACERQPAEYQPEFSPPAASAMHEYVVGIHPLHNPKRLVELYGPVIDHLNASIPQAHFRLEASRNYEDFDKKLFSGYFDFAMPNPYQTVRSLKYGYHVFGKMGDDELFRGIILVRKDSGIAQVSDLKGKKVAYPSPSALAATLMPQYYLHTHGLNVNRDIENLYVGSQESVIMSVLRGHVAAGATWPVPWRTFSQEHPAEAAQLEVRWQTEMLPNNGWVVRQDVPLALTESVGRALVDLSDTAGGRATLTRLGITHFEAANDEIYLPVRRYLERFSATVRPIEY